WTITDEQLAQLLAKHHLIERPKFFGAMVHVKTPEQMVAVADKAIANGSVEYIVFHGVGAEWITTPVETFIALLDGLVARRDQLWITDHISAHQYATERDSAEFWVVANTDRSVRLELKCKA